MPTIRHITKPAGFVAAGVKCGIKASGKEDLAIIAAQTDAAVAVLTTRNQVFGEPVRYCRKVLPKGYGLARGIVINSGCSNVCTGRVGFRDAKRMAEQTAGLLGTKPDKILVASTGIIGHRLPMDKISAGIAAAVGKLGKNNDSAALRAIMTTDTREKSAVIVTKIAGKKVTIAGIVKGSGMIAPSMATLIAVLTTDLAVAPAALHKALRQCVDGSLNAVTIDSDTSTSDTIAIFASGKAGNKPLRAGAGDFKKFRKALSEVLGKLARTVAADGEGATKLITVTVVGARTAMDAEIAAKSVANSPLVKCAIHGGDPNWGRVASSLGKSAAKVDPQKLLIKIGGLAVFARGKGLDFNIKNVERHLRGKEVEIFADLGLGKGKYTALTCDLSREYVTINADYHT